MVDEIAQVHLGCPPLSPRKLFWLIPHLAASRSHCSSHHQALPPPMRPCLVQCCIFALASSAMHHLVIYPRWSTHHPSHPSPSHPDHPPTPMTCPTPPCTPPHSPRRTSTSKASHVDATHRCGLALRIGYEFVDELGCGVRPATVGNGGYEPNGHRGMTRFGIEMVAFSRSFQLGQARQQTHCTHPPSLWGPRFQKTNTGRWSRLLSRGASWPPDWGRGRP